MYRSYGGRTMFQFCPRTPLLKLWSQYQTSPYPKSDAKETVTLVWPALVWNSWYERCQKELLWRKSSEYWISAPNPIWFGRELGNSSFSCQAKGASSEWLVNLAQLQLAGQREEESVKVLTFTPTNGRSR